VSEASSGVGCRPCLVTVLRVPASLDSMSSLKSTDIVDLSMLDLDLSCWFCIAEVIADIALCPFEAVIRVQTQPGFARGLSDGLPKFVKSEGALGYAYQYSSVFLILYVFAYDDVFLTNLSNYYRLYKGLVPLWGRQIPCKLGLGKELD
jgi:hypothetical protein